MKKYTLRDGTVIIEKKEKVNGFVGFGYYINKKHQFGAPKPFSKEDLQRLADNGYFESRGNKMRESTKRAQANYQKKCKQFPLRINKETESDIMEWIARGNAATRIKKLIREDIKKNPVK